MYILDSDTVSNFGRGGYPKLKLKIESTPGNLLWVTIVTVEEAMAGAYQLINNPKVPGNEIRGCQLLRNIMARYSQFQILPYDEAAKRLFSSMPAATKRLGKDDCKIAAIAIAKGYTVITRNVSHFSQIDGVKCENWTD